MSQLAKRMRENPRRSAQLDKRDAIMCMHVQARDMASEILSWFHSIVVYHD